MGKIELPLRPNQEFIVLQSVLQVCDIISTGGIAKEFLATEKVLVNGERETRRGRKLYPGDLVKVLDAEILIVEP